MENVNPKREESIEAALINAEAPFDFIVESQKIEIALKKAFLKRKGRISTSVFILVSLWLSAILAIVIFKGLHLIPGTGLVFEISDAISITLISTTTINVIAFLTIIVKDHFPNHKSVNIKVPEPLDKKGAIQD
ncbi:hypothetical protein ACE38W_17080 [Chitinophaga sp. Hz27]|uniref:hypothetical protein n=1 Tax=Chitinophaga sp. Hz27 TaxID=3347169 RepID=UPI0035DC7A7A